MEDKAKIALVTGGARGIGRAIALELAKSGMDIAVADVAFPAEPSTAKDIQAIGRQALEVKMNVADINSVTEGVEKIEQELGTVTVLVNNAGVTRDNLMMRMSGDEWNTVIDINLTGSFNVSKAVIRQMVKARWGRIINIASVVGQSGNIGQANYASSKAGMIGLAKSLAKELASRNITVNTVAPGFIDTDMTRVLPEKVREALLEQVPMRRLGSAEDIANCVKFLVSDEASYITGQVLAVNGGMYM